MVLRSPRRDAGHGRAWASTSASRVELRGTVLKRNAPPERSMLNAVSACKSEQGPLVVVATHPVQYHAPVYRALEKQHGIAVQVIYGSDFSVAGYYDREFKTSFAWDVDLVGDSVCRFLARV